MRVGLLAAFLATLLVGLLVGYCTGLRHRSQGHSHTHPASIADVPADAPPLDLTGVKPLSWELLATYEYEPGLEGLPAPIQALDGSRVLIDGYLLSLFEYDDIREFHLIRAHWGCCSPVDTPGLYNTILVRLPAKSAGLPNTIKRVRVVGTLRVKEVREEGSDIVWAIYSLDDARAVILTTGQK